MPRGRRRGQGRDDRHERAGARRARATVARLLRRRALPGDRFRLDPDRFRRPRTFTYPGRPTTRGVTREIELDAKLNGTGPEAGGEERIEFELRGELNRRDFGLSWNQAVETGGALLGDKVKMVLEISRATRSEAP